GRRRRRRRAARPRPSPRRLARGPGRRSSRPPTEGDPNPMTPSIAIVGAGFGGLAVALELKAAGIDSFTVLERAQEVGGVWQANTYPGAACDVPSVIYQFSRHLKPDWSRRFGSQHEIRDYLRDVSVEGGVRGHIRFGVEVVAATFDEHEARWVVELAGGETL